MSVRVSPTEKIRGEIDALFDGSRELSEIIEDVARLGARLIIQTAVEAEVDVFLGRAHYQRAAECPDARAGSRNGFCESTIKTTAGPVTVARPKLRGTTERFASQLFGTGVTKSNALESLVIAGFVRGLSVRDVENTLADALGAEAALSKSTVSRVCQAIGDEFTALSSPMSISQSPAGNPPCHGGQSFLVELSTVECSLEYSALRDGSSVELLESRRCARVAVTGAAKPAVTECLEFATQMRQNRSPRR